jgi:hypothetical protein
MAATSNSTAAAAAAGEVTAASHAPCSSCLTACLYVAAAGADACFLLLNSAATPCRCTAPAVRQQLYNAAAANGLGWLRSGGDWSFTRICVPDVLEALLLDALGSGGGLIDEVGCLNMSFTVGVGGAMATAVWVC